VLATVILVGSVALMLSGVVVRRRHDLR
jgi:hypothetical protein